MTVELTPNKGPVTMSLVITSDEVAANLQTSSDILDSLILVLNRTRETKAILRSHGAAISRSGHSGTPYYLYPLSPQPSDKCRPQRFLSSFSVFPARDGY
jgi:hypothetical protein